MTAQEAGSERLTGALIGSGLGTDLTDEELRQVAALAVEHEFKKGVRILEEGSKSRDIYIILEGQVSVMLDITAMYKMEERVARMNDNGIFGEFAFLSGEARSASIQAESKVTLLLLKYETLMGFFVSHPTVGLKLMRNIGVIVTKRVADQRKMLRKLLFDS